MKFFGSSTFLTILSESIRLVFRNGKLMAFIALSSVLLKLCSLSLLGYFTQYVIANMVASSQQSLFPDPDMPIPVPTDPSPNMGFDPSMVLPTLPKGYVAILLAAGFTFFLLLTISFVSTISTILVSAASHQSSTLSLRQLLSTILKTWKNPLITTFYFSLLSSGYFSSIIALTAPFLMLTNLVAVYLVGIISFILYLYLLVPWILSIIASVVEGSCCGLEALGKGAELVKGKRLQGFLLNLVFTMVFLILHLGYKMTKLGKHDYRAVTIVLTSVVSLVRMLHTVAYSVFYLQCKKLHGEEIELPGTDTLQYTKLPVTHQFP